MFSSSTHITIVATEGTVIMHGYKQICNGLWIVIFFVGDLNSGPNGPKSFRNRWLSTQTGSIVCSDIVQFYLWRGTYWVRGRDNALPLNGWSRSRL